MLFQCLLACLIFSIVVVIMYFYFVTFLFFLIGNYLHLYRKNLFMKEKLNKKEQHNLYTLFTIYRSNIVGKTNQFKHNSLFINLFYLQCECEYVFKRIFEIKCIHLTSVFSNTAQRKAQ